MRMRIVYVIPLVLLAFAAGWATTPNALDPVRVAPHIYQLEWQNEQVRVLKKTVRHGETPPLHALRDRVEVYLNGCAWLEEDEQGNSSMTSFRAGESVWASAATLGGDTAKVVDICGILVIEML